MGWTALCPLELDIAAKACWNFAKSQGQAFQALTAYMFLATCRNNEKWEAVVSDEVAASYVPKVRGGGSLTKDGYRKGVKPFLKQCGLVDYNDAPRNEKGKAGRRATRYTFPALETYLDICTPSDDADEFPEAPRVVIPEYLIRNYRNNHA